MEDKLKAIDKNKMSKAEQDQLSLWVYFSQLGLYTEEEQRKETRKQLRELPEFKEIVKEHAGKVKEVIELKRELEEQKDLIIEEAKKKNLSIPEIVKYYFKHPEELKKLVGVESLVKVAIPLQKQLLGLRPQVLKNGVVINKDTRQLALSELFEDFSYIQKAEKGNIEYIGFNLNRSQDRAVLAIQKLLNENNYQSNATEEQLQQLENIRDTALTLIFTPSQYYEAYEVTKYKTSRDKEEWSSGESKNALKALEDISMTKGIVAYNTLDREATKKAKQNRFKRIEFTTSLLDRAYIYNNLTEEETELNTNARLNKKIKYIVIRPSKIFMDQIENGYFSLLPASLYADIEKLFPNDKSRQLPFLIKWIGLKVTENRIKTLDHKIEINLLNLAADLRMENYLRANKTGKVKSIIKDKLEKVTQYGALTRYTIEKGKKGQDKVVMYINPRRFNNKLIKTETRKIGNS
ncbi:MAG: hypothetical protein ACYDIA_09565 [Candidatus Humimicrobiaceae bacterium]